jgi:DNA polymerase-1
MNINPHDDKRLFLLDAFALIYRAYFAFSRNPLMNSKGMNVSAASGFTNTLVELMLKEKPTHIAVVFDSAAETNRAVEHSFYKAHREAMPEDIQSNLPWIKEIIRAFNIPMLELAGYEADDIIGTIAKVKAREGHVVYMVTPDKDYGQLVEPNIFMYKPARMGNDIEILGVPEICAKWEIDDPLKVIDILGMWGDASDNIPGIPGIGEKTAKKLIQQYGSMENMIAHSHELKGKMKENVEAFVDQAHISKMLATIILDVPIEVSDDDLLISEPDREKLAALFTELEFRSMGRRILGADFSVNQQIAPEVKKSIPAAPKPSNGQISMFGEENAPEEDHPEPAEKGKNISNTPHTYFRVESESELKNLADLLSQQTEFCFDTETSSLDYFSLELVGLSFSVKEGEAYYVPTPSDKSEVARILSYFKPLLESKTILKIGQNVKFDLLVLRQFGVEVSLPVYDTMLAHYLVEPDMKHGMDYLSETYLGYTPVSITELIGKRGKNQGTMRDVPVEQVVEYASEDADITLQLKHVIQPMVEKREVVDVLQKIELPLIPVLADMEYEGVKVDEAFLANYSGELQSDLILLRDAIWEMAGQEFNIDSPKQLGEILFDKLKLPSVEKTKTGQYATGEEILSKLEKDHPIAAKLLDYREITKLKSTYVDSLPNLINPVTGRIHTTFNQTIAATGRLSSVSPNLQNIPIRTDRGQQVRKAFIARDADHVLVSADYSQIELRLVAEIAKEEAMLDAFTKGIDIHQATAARVYGVALEDVTREMRSKAKMVNFGIIYSISAFGLSQRLGVPRKEAAELIENYFAQYPGIKGYMSSTLEFARANGFVKTMMGRRRYLKDINSRNFTIRGFAEREAINSPVQGSAADLIKMAMIGIHQELKEKNLRSKMTLQVHDELVFDAHKDELEILKPIILHHMRTAFKTTVPIEVEIGTGMNWLEAH